jgi:small subunit ribosomal protein S19e
MVSIKDADQQRLIKQVSVELRKNMQMPDWAAYVKTGVSRERPPENEDWWFLRSASMLRKISLEGPVGVQRLRSYYGGRQRRGHKPAHFRKGSGKIVRVILQDLEKLGYIKKVEKPKKGRIVTSQGQKLLSAAAKTVK